MAAMGQQRAPELSPAKVWACAPQAGGPRTRPPGKSDALSLAGSYGGAQGRQNSTFMDIWSCRDVPKSPAANRVPPVIMPSVEDPIVVPGLVKLAWLSASNASARN